MKPLITLTLFAVAAFGQTTINPPSFSVNAENTTYMLAWMARIYKDGTTPTTLAAPIDAVTTTVTVANGQGLGANSVISVGTEHMTVTARTGGTLTVTRGTNGSTAAAAQAGATVGELKWKTMAAVAREIAMMSFRKIAKEEQMRQAQAQLETTAEASVTTGIQ